MARGGARASQHSSSVEGARGSLPRRTRAAAPVQARTAAGRRRSRRRRPGRPAQGLSRVCEPRRRGRGTGLADGDPRQLLPRPGTREGATRRADRARSRGRLLPLPQDRRRGSVPLLRFAPPRLPAPVRPRGRARRTRRASRALPATARALLLRGLPGERNRLPAPGAVGDDARPPAPGAKAVRAHTLGLRRQARTTEGERETMITCAEAVRQLWEYLDGVVEETDRKAIEEHLSFCRRCCGELDRK